MISTLKFLIRGLILGVTAKGYCVSTVGLDEEKVRKCVKWQQVKDKRMEQLNLLLGSSYIPSLLCVVVKYNSLRLPSCERSSIFNNSI